MDFSLKIYNFRYSIITALQKSIGGKFERRYAKTQQFNSDWFLNGGTVFFPFCILQYSYKTHVLCLEWEKMFLQKNI